MNSLPVDSAPKSLSVSSPVQRDIEAVSNTGAPQVMLYKFSVSKTSELEVQRIL